MPDHTIEELTILPNDKTIPSAIIRQGVIPTTPTSPDTGVSIRCLELYRVAKLRTPQISIQSWMKTLCDIHLVSLVRFFSYRRWLTVLR